MPTFFDVAVGDLRVHGALVTADTQTGRATAIERVAVAIPEAAAKPAPGASETPEPPEAAGDLECP